MKKVKFTMLKIVVVASVVFFAVCCSKTDNLTLSLESNTLEFTADGGKQSVDVVTNVKSWEVVPSADWLKIGRSGVDFSVTVGKYTDPTQDRVGEITVKAGNAKPVIVTVKQSAPPPNTIVSSTYTANGIPYPYIDPAPGSWTGTVTPSGNNRYKISNWANIGNDIPMFLNYVDDKFVLDGSTKVDENASYNIYYGAGYDSGTDYFRVNNYVVNYNPATRTLDFSGTYNGYQIYVGLWAQVKSTGAWAFVINTQVRNVKLVLTPLSPSSLKNSNMQPVNISLAPSTVTRNSVVFIH